MKLFIVGHGRHGKDTVADILRDCYGLTFQSSSLFAAENVVRPWLAKLGIEYDTLDECYEDRGNHRSKWFDAINEYNTPDLTKLSRAIFDEYDMYVGIRNREEFLASRKYADLAVWVDAFDRVPPEASTSCTIRRSDADVIIDNSRDLQELERKVHAFAAIVYGV